MGTLWGVKAPIEKGGVVLGCFVIAGFITILNLNDLLITWHVYIVYTLMMLLILLFISQYQRSLLLFFIGFVVLYWNVWLSNPVDKGILILAAHDSFRFEHYLCSVVNLVFPYIML